MTPTVTASAGGLATFQTSAWVANSYELCVKSNGIFKQVGGSTIAIIQPSLVVSGTIVNTPAAVQLMGSGVAPGDIVVITTSNCNLASTLTSSFQTLDTNLTVPFPSAMLATTGPMVVCYATQETTNALYAPQNFVKAGSRELSYDPINFPSGLSNNLTYKLTINFPSGLSNKLTNNALYYLNIPKSPGDAPLGTVIPMYIIVAAQPFQLTPH